MFHHDHRDYTEAASAAAKKGRVKMEEIIDKGRKHAQEVVEQIESRVIQDQVAKAPAIKLSFDDDGDPRLLTFGDTIDSRPLHKHAYSQLLTVTKVGKKFADTLVEEAGGKPWGKRLVAENVNTILAHRDDRHLIRAEVDTDNNQLVKGFLSDGFRRLDCRPILDGFMKACIGMGLLPIDGVASDTKCRVRAVLPVVFEPIDNEVMLFGAEFGNSDYGDGGVVVNLWTMRVWCTNLAITEKCLRKVHVGSRLADDFKLSQETYLKDAETMALAVRDITKEIIAPARVNGMLESIKKAGEKEIKSSDGIDKLLGRSLEKNELAQVKQIFDGPDVVNVPPGHTAWRLSNAVSWFAQNKSVNPDRKIQLQTLAGSLVA